uniref:Nitric oxide-associated protein 1 n=1 Tax=Rhabditophanes sp. KR3021 TaxID=114890 RepID=A0AC35TXZ0_9BILA
MIEELGLDLTENGPPQTGEPCILGDYCEKEVLDKVIGFLSFSDNLTGESLTNIQKDEANASRINYLSTAFPIKDDPQTIFKAILVGNYLDIPILLETGCSVVAKNMAGLSTEELREKFDIKDDFTEEERYHVRKVSSKMGTYKSHGRLQEKILKRFENYKKEYVLAGADNVKNELETKSIAVERFMKSSDPELYERLNAKHVLNKSGIEKDVNSKPVFPMTTFASIGFTENVNESYKSASKIDVYDRGFHMGESNFVSEYTAGTVAELDQDEMTAPEIEVFGSSNAVENIQFQLPGQAAKRNEAKAVRDERNTVEVSEEDAKVESDLPPSDKSCAGCGANFQCNHTSLPGFMPFTNFIQLGKPKHSNCSNTLCRRCHLLKEHNFLLNVNVSPLDYESMMGHLKQKEEALILLVVDMTDLPFSIYEQLPKIIGQRKPVIVIGNKIDLLPPDAQIGYLKNFRNVLYKTLEDIGFKDQFNILHTTLVSAKTGYGIEDLITQIYLKWSNIKGSIRNNMYLIGSTNAGKSSLFNAFLQSDLCKMRAMDLIERAAASPWPGTTMNLLKFPVMNPTSHQTEIRKRRLLKVSAWAQKEGRSARMMLRDTGEARFATLMGSVGSSFKENDEKSQPMPVGVLKSGFDTSMRFEENSKIVNYEEKGPRTFNPEDPTFSKGFWCFDTPGVVNQDQLMNIFTLKELISIFPKEIMAPRSFLLNAGQTLLIGGISQIATMETTVYLTVFCSPKLPINIIETSEVDNFLKKFLGTPILVAPCGNEQRMAEYPDFGGKDFQITGKGLEEGVCDIALSSIGWIMISSKERQLNKINVKTPAANGIWLREYPLLPGSINLKGSRIPGTQGYKVKPLAFPEDAIHSKSKGKRRA